MLAKLTKNVCLMVASVAGYRHEWGLLIVCVLVCGLVWAAFDAVEDEAKEEAEQPESPAKEVE